MAADAQGLAEGLAVLFESSPEERASMGRRGRDLVERQFTWPTVAMQMRDVYGWLLGEAPKPEPQTRSLI